MNYKLVKSVNLRTSKHSQWHPAHHAQWVSGINAYQPYILCQPLSWQSTLYLITQQP